MYKSIIQHNRLYSTRISHWSVLPRQEQPPIQYPAVVVYEPVQVVSGGGRKIIRDFAHGDFPGALLLAAVPPGSMILQTLVEVVESFDAGGLTVGTQTAQGLLVTTGQLTLVQGAYEVASYLKLDESMSFKAFLSGTPATGAGRIIIIYL